MIERAVRDEQGTGRLAGAIRAFAEENDCDPSEDQVRGAVAFVREYVEHVPCYLEQALGAAERAGVKHELMEMVRGLEAYWFEENHARPHRAGLMGRMDDAYASLSLLQAYSNVCRTLGGHPLLAHDLTQANLVVRQLIGEPGASHLDHRVGMTISQAMMLSVVGQIAASGFHFGHGPDPIWGDASVDDIVTARLGAMGVV
jgi:hypothetical protein